MEGNKRTTMEDIAKELGVSKNAVSLALRGKRGVSEQLRGRVLEAAQALHYGQFPHTGPLRYIVAMFPRYLTSDDDHLFYHQVCYYMEAHAKELGYQLLLASVTDAEEKSLSLPALLTQLTCAGVMTIGNLSLPYCRKVAATGLRYIMVDQYYDGLPISCVTTTNSTGSYLLTRHLIENGHRHIEYMGQRTATASLRDRWEGYCRAMHEFKLPVRKNTYQLTGKREAQNEYELIHNALEQMGRMPTAFFCGHDCTAEALIRVLAKQGLHVPRDISVVGFDDIQRPDVLPLRLTTYRTRKEEIARTAVHLFANHPTSPLHVSIHGELVFRDSVRRLDADAFGEALVDP